MAARNIPIREELLGEIEKIAQAQGRSSEEVLEEALDRFIKEKQWSSLKSYGRNKAREQGVTEDDVDTAIADTRGLSR
jgi:predicted transcriptional regulator